MSVLGSCSEQTFSPLADVFRPSLKQRATLAEHGVSCPHPSQAGVQLRWLHHVLLMAKGEGPGMPAFEPHPSSWLPRKNCQWGVPGHKKWSSSWGLDYFTWKTQAFFFSCNHLSMGQDLLLSRVGMTLPRFIAWPVELWDKLPGLTAVPALPYSSLPSSACPLMHTTLRE